MDFEVEQIRQVFSAETQEDLGIVEQALLKLEASPADAECVATVFRKFHTLKGNAASCDLKRLSELAHRIEDLLDGLRSGSAPVTPDLITYLLEVVDLVRTVLPSAAAGRDDLTPAGEALLRRVEGGRLLEPAAAGEPGSASGAGENDLEFAAEAGRTLRIDVERLDDLLRVTSEMVIALGRLRLSIEQQGTPEIATAFRPVERLVTSMHHSVSKVRLVPIGPLLRRHGRVVRDLAVGQRKQAELVVSDAGVEVDNSLIAQLKAPLTHLVRNAVDHGLESPAARRRAGKSARGRIELRARHEASDIVLEIEDDGAGLDRRRILERARALGVAGGGASLPDRDVDRLIFSQGLSTARRVSQASGRGVGLDVVRKHVDALGGSVEVESQPGRGTKFTIRMPLTLAVIEGLLGRVGDMTVVIPMSGVVRCLDLCGALPASAAEGVLNLAGRAVPVMRLRTLFTLAGDPPPSEVAVVIEKGGEPLGLVVDRLAGRAQIVVRPPGRFFNGLSAVAGLTVLGDGQVAPILNVSGLRQPRTLRGAEAAPARPDSAAAEGA